MSALACLEGPVFHAEALYEGGAITPHDLSTLPQHALQDTLLILGHSFSSMLWGQGAQELSDLPSRWGTPAPDREPAGPSPRATPSPLPPDPHL